MLSKIPDLSIEILGNELFFPTTTINSLFESLKNIDLNVSETTAKRQTASGNSDMFVKKSGEISDKDEYIEASVENVAFDEKHERIVVSVKIQQRAKGGAFAKLYGKYRIEHLYKMKNGVVDPSNAENMAYLPLIFLKNGSRILFVPEKNESRVLTIKPDFKIK